jgi:hypothetical protein
VRNGIRQEEVQNIEVQELHKYFQMLKIQSFLSYKFWTSFAGFTILSFIFGLVYRQDSIYKSPENQNTKYLQGLAEAGFGFLNEDWTANTIDPLPAFTFLVKTLYQISHSEYFFYLCYFIIFGSYLWGILFLINYVFKVKKEPLKYLVYIVLFILLNTETTFHYGVAEQYILGPVFQPCNFGAFILLSICAFVSEKYCHSVALLALAATFHPAYIPSAAILTVSYMLVIFRQEKNIARSLQIGLLSLVLVLPVVSYMHFTFTPTTPEMASQAEHIIVNYRIPHHSLPEVWLNKKGDDAYLKIFLMVSAIYLIRKTKIFLILFVPFITTAVLTVVQLLIHNDTLAFIAPWRVSSFLVPISTAIILERIISFIFQKNQKLILKNRQKIWQATLISLAIIFVLGSWIQLKAWQKEDDTIPMLNFVKQNKQSGEVYLVPPQSRDLRKFRLYTGAPILINEKSHPYKDKEVIEWYDRVETANKFYANDLNSCNTLHNLVNKYKITHVVLEKEQFDLECDLLSNKLYKDEEYALYKLEK